MSDVKKVLNQHLLLPKIFGSCIFNADGRLNYFQLARIVVCIGSYIYTTFPEFQHPKIDFKAFVGLIRHMLTICLLAVLVHGSCREKYWIKSLEAIESLSEFLTTSKTKIIIWPSIASNIFFIGIILSIGVPRELIIRYALNAKIFLLINAFTDEFSIKIFLLCSLSESINARLAKTVQKKDLESLLKVQDTLCSAVRHINGLYSTHLLATLAFSFYNTTLSIFFLVKDNDKPTFEIVRTVICILAYLQLYVKIILSVSLLMERMHAFDICLYEKLKTRPSSWMELVQVEDIIADRNICFSAAGFFDLTIENLGSMISAATTYLVILLQMD